MPALVLWFPAQVVVPGTMMSYLPLGTAQFIQLRRDVNYKVLALIVGGAVIGMPVGAIILRDTDTEMMRRAIGLAMIGLAICLQFKPSAPFKRETAACLGIGTVSGVLSASIGVSGPPLVLLGLKQMWPQAQFRATLITCFLCTSSLSLMVQRSVGVLTFESLQFVVWGAPGLAFGFLTSSWLRKHLHRTSIFRWISIGVVITGGLAAAFF